MKVVLAAGGGLGAGGAFTTEC